MTTLLAGAELVERRSILPGQWIGSFHAPGVAAGARAGQYVHLRIRDGPPDLGRHPVPINTVDASVGVLTLHLSSNERDAGWGACPDRLRPGDAVDLVGPFGRPFEVDPRSRHLLLVTEGRGVAALRLLVDEAIRNGRQVTLLFGAPTSRDVYPSTLLPDEVEYVVATADGSLGHHGSVTDLVGDFEAWADQAFAAGPLALLGILARQAAGRRARLGVATLGRKRGGGRPDPAGSPAARRKSYLQVALDQTVGCAEATCLGCAVLGAGGAPLRVCRDGPVFAASELAWDGAE